MEDLPEDLSLLKKLKSLNSRQAEIFQYICAGKLYKEIAEQLSIERATVQYHATEMYVKLDIYHLPRDQRRQKLGKFCLVLDYLRKEDSAFTEVQDFKYEAELEAVTEPKSLLIPVSYQTALNAVLEDDGSFPFPEPPIVQIESGDWRSGVRNRQPTYRRSQLVLLRALLFAIIIAFIGGLVGGGVIVLLGSLNSTRDIATTNVSAVSPTQTQHFITQVSPLISTAFPPLVSSPGTSMATLTPSPVAVDVVNACGESGRVVAPQADRFMRSQGISSFTVANTNGAVLNDKVRSIAIDQRGLWIGYFATSQNLSNGMGHYDKKSWAHCNFPGGEIVESKDINAIAVDPAKRVWAATWKGGVAMLDETGWHSFTRPDGLPSNETFGLTVDKDNIWVATWEGIAKFNINQGWTVPYKVEDNTIVNNHTHAIAFDAAGNIWVGHLRKFGVSQYDNTKGLWVHHTVETGALSENDIFSIAVRKAEGRSPESVWFATGNGVSRYEQGRWTAFRVEDGLPGNMVRAVVVDPFNRVWAATNGGVAYFDGSTWTTYTTIDSHAIAFGPDCQDCPFDEDHVWIGTDKLGLTHSRIPLTTTHVIDVIKVEYPQVVSPGEKFRAEITIAPRDPYQLREDRGDFLSNIDASDEKLYGAWVHMPVRGIVDPGQQYTFTDYDMPFVAPQLGEGEQEKMFTSRWRVWMHTRYVGPVIEITFTVRKAHTTSTP